VANLSSGGSTPPDAAVVPASPVGGDILVQDLTALVKIGQDELDDTPAATSQMLAEVLGDAVAEFEDAAIAAGTGSGQPRGLTLAANITAVPAAQKTTASVSNTPSLADMLAVPWTLPDRYRPRAVWLIQPKAAAKIASLVYASGARLARVRGARLPDPSTAGTTDASVIFGDIRSAYRLVDRQRMTLQRLSQHYADTGDVGLLLHYRAGGDVVRPGALSVYFL
jgi:HK97 family phage major capsid protein